MMRSQYLGGEPNFQKFIIASAILHLVFIALVTIPIKAKKREYKSYYVNIVTPSEIGIRPRVRHTPKKAVQKSKKKSSVKTSRPVMKKAVPRKRLPPRKGVALEPEKTIEKEIERLRALSAIAKKKSYEQKKAAALARLKSRINESITVTSEAPGEQAKTDHNAYAALVRQKIWDEWIYPYTDAQGLEVIISFVIKKDGDVSNTRIVKFSGNSLYDRSAMKAILKASPFPPPAVEEEFEVRFHL
jgi:colicin import membrane protein